MPQILFDLIYFSLFCSSVKIIDDDDTGYNPAQFEIDEGDLYATNEEAPQIVGVIDERAPDVILKQDYQGSSKWKTFASSSKEESHTENYRKTNKRSHSSDASPQRKKTSPDRSRRQKESPDTLFSRKSKRNNSSDSSPPRRQIDNRSLVDNLSRRDKRVPRRDSDASPPRRRQISAERSSLKRSAKSPDKRKPRPDSDASPLRRRRRSSDRSPPRRSVKSSDVRKLRRNSDASPPRRRKPEYVSPSRQRSRRSPDIKQETSSPPNYNRDSPPRSSKMSKTLDGKASGLQDAKTLKRENDAFKEKQERMFSEMSHDVSGRNADIVIRDRRGRNKNFEKELESERQKQEAEAARKKVYDRWGKGLKQIEDIEKSYQEHIHEASKPFARSADDADLQDHLRHQERIDDPMLEYFRKKKQEENNKKGIPEMPMYRGQFPDNRFNIRPGYRWDGVDRSNGFEKKYFMMINSKKSMEEEAYRYATEDM